MSRGARRWESLYFAVNAPSGWNFQFDTIIELPLLDWLLSKTQDKQTFWENAPHSYV